ncbi:MAG: Flp pilus assembly complex ATPase component TadA, partial [Desulfobacterales bacterium]|nr:Flp pilus assembly complex ATPase component TadA [Desulfobacterales bacterium]
MNLNDKKKSNKDYAKEIKDKIMGDSFFKKKDDEVSMTPEQIEDIENKIHNKGNEKKLKRRNIFFGKKEDNSEKRVINEEKVDSNLEVPEGASSNTAELKSVDDKVSNSNASVSLPSMSEVPEESAQRNVFVEDQNYKRERAKIDKKELGDLVERYSIDSDNLTSIDVEIRKKGIVTTYNLRVPEVDIATKAVLEEVRNELITTTTIGMNEIVDPDALDGIKKRFLSEAGTLLQRKVPTVSKQTKDVLINRLLQDMLGLGEIEFLIQDANLEEIVIPSAKEPIRVYHKKYGWLPSSLHIGREDEIVNYSNIIARRVGRQITVLNPLLDAHLSSGDRVNSVLYPISTKGNTITIRRFARDPYTIIDLIENKTLDIDVAVLLWLAVEYEMNVIVSGGTAAGKTVILNSVMPFIPPNHRILSVEDTRELMLPDFLYWTPLVTRSPNPEGKGEISMLDLLVNSLRMRPDRIVLGEMRRKEEAMVMFEAMHTGH